MRKVQLSVSSIILASVLSSCSQNSLSDNNQTSAQPVSSSSVTSLTQKIAELSKPETMSPDSFYESKAHKKERLARLKLVLSRQHLLPQKRTVKVSVAKSVQFKKVVYKASQPKSRPVVRRKSRLVRSIHKLPLPKVQAKRCHAKVKLPAKYVTKSKRVFIQKASSRRVFIRAPQYRWINKKILVRKASYKKRVISAKYKTAKKRILLRPTKTIRTFVPAVYKTVKRKIRIAPALYKTVKTPARYKIQNYRQKVASARYVWRSRTCQTNTPQRVRKAGISKNKFAKKQHRRVIQTSQRSAIINKPLVRAADESGYMQLNSTYDHAIRATNTKPVKKINPRIKNTTHDKLRRDATILLNKVSLKQEKNLKHSKALKKPKKQLSNAQKKLHIVISIQKSLKARGFDSGKVDGILGTNTAAALKAFQRQNGLEPGKLNKETLQALRVVRS